MYLTKPVPCNSSMEYLSRGLSSGLEILTSTPFGNTLSQPFALQLDKNNYILWKTMVSTIIRGHRLDGFINGMRQPPAEFIPSRVATEDGIPAFGVRVNPMLGIKDSIPIPF
uniref:Retrotransposon Copia-like N-terminal domain-containing protein n=1 Tax=Cannabis sativa TaxID=3483 RepID=A0A803QAX9_CANSA